MDWKVGEENGLSSNGGGGGGLSSSKEVIIVFGSRVIEGLRGSEAKGHAKSG